MSSESDFIEMLRGIASHPAARGLQDDCAVLQVGNETLILTHDAMVSGVHFFDDADPADVARKLVAVNLSDLAAKGAEPLGVLLGYTLADSDWNAGFVEGLRAALNQHRVPLLGGDTVAHAAPQDRAVRHFGLTAIGSATTAAVPSRSGAEAGDRLFITGPVGGAYAGYLQLRDGQSGPASLLEAFLRPTPLLATGKALAPHVCAMMDVSDGVLIDTARMARASGLAVRIDIAKIPFDVAASAQIMPKAAVINGAAFVGDIATAKRAEPALTFGDDYQLLFTLPENTPPTVPCWQIGHFTDGAGLHLTLDDMQYPLPGSLGFEHS